MNRIAGLVFLFSVLSAPAFAEADASTFLEQYDAASGDEKKRFESAAINMYLGIGWAESAIENRSQNRVRLYCQPGDVTLTGPVVIDHMKDFLFTHSTLETEPYGLVVLLATMDSWPCARPTNVPNGENGDGEIKP